MTDIQLLRGFDYLSIATSFLIIGGALFIYFLEVPKKRQVRRTKGK